MGVLSTNEKQALNVIKRNLIATYVPKDQQEEALRRYTYYGVWEGDIVSNSILFGYQKIKGKIGQWTGDLKMEEDAANKIREIITSYKYKSRDKVAWSRDIGNTRFQYRRLGYRIV